MLKLFSKISKQIKGENSTLYLLLWFFLVLFTQYNGLVLFCLLLFIPLLIVNLNRIFASIRKHTGLSIAWITMLFYYFFHSVYQSSIPPLSIAQTINQVIYFCFFLLALDLFSEKKSREAFVTKILIYGFSILIPITVGMQLFTTNEIVLEIFRSFLPFYGHNHFPSILLVFFPLVISSYINYQDKSNGLIVFIWSLAFLLSAGRVLLILGLIELGIVAFSYRKKLKMNIVLGTIFLLWICAILWFGFLNTKIYICNLYEVSNYCKSLDHDVRLRYWQQALKIVESKPLFGSGLGTFLNESQRYMQTQRLKTGYAHNDFLQIVSETGFLGGLAVLVLFLSFVLVLIRSLKLTASSDKKLVLMGIVFLIINGFFDFDLSYSAAKLTLILALALIIATNKHEEQRFASRVSSMQKISTLFISLLIVLTTIYTLLSSLQRATIALGKADFGFERVPIIFTFPKDKLESTVKQLSVQNRQKLDSIYTNYVDYWLSRVNDDEISSQPEIRASIIDKVNSMQPWSRINFNNAKYYLSIGKPEESYQESVKNLNFIQETTDNGYYVFRDYHYWRITNDLIASTLQFLHDAEYMKAKKALKLALSLNGNLLAEIDPLLSGEVTNLEEIYFIDIIAESYALNLGKNTISYRDRIKKLLVVAYTEKNLPAVHRTLELLNMLDNSQTEVLIVDYFEWVIRNQGSICEKNTEKHLCRTNVRSITQVVNNNLRLILDELSYPERLNLSRLLFRVLQQIDVEDQVVYESIIKTANSILPLDYWTAVQLGNYYVSTGDLENANQAFDFCLQQFNNQHDDCLAGKQTILNGNPNNLRFDQVSQIILGEKRWQDFQ